MTEKENRDFTEIWFRNSHEEWIELATDQYNNKLRDRSLSLENYFDDIDINDVKNCTPEEFYDFLHDKFLVWQYSASSLPMVQKHLSKHLKNMEELGQIRDKLFTFDHEDIRAGLMAAQDIYGLGYTAASGLLSVLFPDDFASIDKTMLATLQSIDGFMITNTLRKMDLERSTLTECVIITELIRRKAASLNKINHTDFWNVRNVDKALWAFSAK